METLITIIAAFGGLELIKWVTTRRQNLRMADARADAEEFHALREYNEFLQNQLMGKEERFAEQTTLVRNLNKEVIELTRDNNNLRLELQRKRCEVKDCSLRIPPTGELASAETS